MQTQYPRLRKATLLTASTLTVMAGAIIAPALPQISREFSHVQGIELLSRLILTLPALFMSMLAPVAGYFIDKTGRKKVLLFSLVLYAVAGTSGLYFNSLPWLLAGRAVLGIAVGGLITAVITLIGDYYEGDHRNRFMGTQAAFAGLGGLIFISSGGVLADIHWRLPFLIYAASLIVLFMARVSVNEPEDSQTPRDSSVNKITGIHPAKIPVAVYSVYVITFFSMIVFYMIPVQMPFMLSALEGVSNTGIGFAIAFVNVASVTTSVNYGRIRRYLSYQKIMALVFFIVFIGLFIISQAQTYWAMISGILMCGFGFGLLMPNLNLWLISLAPATLRGRLVGYLNSALFLGMFMSPIALQPLIYYSSLQGSFFIMGIILLTLALIFLVYAWLRRKKTTVAQ